MVIYEVCEHQSYECISIVHAQKQLTLNYKCGN